MLIDKSSIALQKEKNGQIINCIQHNKKKTMRISAMQGKKQSLMELMQEKEELPWVDSQGGPPGRGGI